jgi:hypothetical protein
MVTVSLPIMLQTAVQLFANWSYLPSAFCCVILAVRNDSVNLTLLLVVAIPSEPGQWPQANKRSKFFSSGFVLLLACSHLLFFNRKIKATPHVPRRRQIHARRSLLGISQALVPTIISFR